LIGSALDAGASIVLPQVETVEQAKHICSAAKFGRKANGTRSAPPGRWYPGLSDQCLNPAKSLHLNLNEQAAIIIQIESLAGIHNLDAILTECGDQIDSVWLGSLDARVSMDLAGGGLMGPEKEWLEAVALYESTLAKHNKPASGLAFGPPEAKATLSKGKSMIFGSADVLGYSKFIIVLISGPSLHLQWVPFSSCNRFEKISLPKITRKFLNRSSTLAIPPSSWIKKLLLFTGSGRCCRFNNRSEVRCNKTTFSEPRSFCETLLISFRSLLRMECDVAGYLDLIDAVLVWNICLGTASADMGDFIFMSPLSQPVSFSTKFLALDVVD
jgi:hypothetical protein